MKEYEPEFDQLLFYLPLSGSAFKKVYYDELLDRAVSKFVPADDLIVPYTATSLEDADAMILLTEWKEFRAPDFGELKKQLKNPVIFDGRNQYNDEKLKSLGFEYHQIGKVNS
jgi:UDPglucose 6-dehydrogenase